MFGIHRNTRHKLRAIVVAILVISAVMSSSTITRADAVTTAMSSSTITGADAVTNWNAIAVQALATAAPPRPGPVSFLDLAIVQAAVHDAVQAIDGRFEPYHVEIPDASGSPEAAAAKAAHDVLINILPSQTASLDTTYHDYMAAHGLAENDPGVRAGELAAAGILALRANDGRVPNPLPPAFIGGTAPGVWRPTPSNPPTGPPPSFAPMATPWLGAVPPFTLKGGDQFRAKAPPPWLGASPGQRGPRGWRRMDLEPSHASLPGQPPSRGLVSRQTTFSGGRPRPQG